MTVGQSQQTKQIPESFELNSYRQIQQKINELMLQKQKEYDFEYYFLKEKLKSFQKFQDIKENHEDYDFLLKYNVMKITKEQRKQQQPQKKNKQQLQQMFRNSDIKKYRQTFLQKLKTDLQKCNTKIQQIKNDIREKIGKRWNHQR